LSDAEIDLFLEAVNFRYLHFQVVSKPKRSAGPSSDQLTAGGIENVEIVVEAGEGHQPAHGQPGHIDKKSKIPNIGDQRRVDRWFA